VYECVGQAYCGLVEEDDLAVADESDGNRDAALFAARERLGLAVAELLQAHVGEHGVDGRGLALGGYALEARIEEQVVLHREVAPQHIVLRAHANAHVHIAHLAADAVPINGGVATRRLVQAREDVDQRSLAGAVGAQQAENGVRVNRHRDTLHRHLGRRKRLAHVVHHERARHGVLPLVHAPVFCDHVPVINLHRPSPLTLARRGLGSSVWVG
jgi:hypothetical protein